MQERKIPFYLHYFTEDDLNDTIAIMKKYSSLDHDRDVVFQKFDENVIELEKRVIAITGVRHTIAVRSEVSALLVALQALEIKRNHKVICSAYCHPFVAECIRYFDAEPIFVDIDLRTFSLLPEKCEELLNGKDKRRIKAIIVSHIGGILADMKPFYEIKEHFNVALIEDLSCALGLQDVHGQFAGTNLQTDFAITACFSGFSRKIFNAGMIFTSNGELAKRCQTLRYHSLIRDISNHGLFYDVVDVSLDHSINVLSSKMALNYLETLKDRLKRRREIAKIYQEGLQDIGDIELIEERETNIYTSFFIRFKKSRDKIASLLYENGIQAELHFVPMNLLSYYKNKYLLKVSQFPNALQVYQEALSLPIYYGMSDDDVCYVVEAIRKIMKGGLS